MKAIFRQEESLLPGELLSGFQTNITVSTVVLFSLSHQASLMGSLRYIGSGKSS